MTAFTEALELCTSFKRTGCVLLWWVVAGSRAPGLDTATMELSDWWMNPTISQALLGRARQRGSTFPVREGDLHDVVRVFESATLQCAAAEELVSRWWPEAWTYLGLRSLNALAGTAPGLYPGRWTQLERSAAASLREAVLRKGVDDVTRPALTLGQWQKEMSGKQVGYSGEEVSVCHSLSWDQILPALPPEEHGGCIDALEWVGDRTRNFLLNPHLLLKDPESVQLPKMPGRVHMVDGDRRRIANELVRRGVCHWIPLSEVYSVRGVKVLNGLFGVEKPSKLDDGRAILRCIMNLTGSNSTQLQLEGGTDTLPGITSWLSLVVDNGEVIETFQSDMSSAFYLFRLPRCWLRYLSFNVVYPGNEVGFSSNAEVALACGVIPMGWHNSVGVMQEISENLLKRSTISPLNQVVRGRSLPCWFSDILAHSTEEDKFWWHIYLDNFCAGERLEMSAEAVKANLCHQAAESAWAEAGVVSSKSKRVSAARKTTELGAEIHGEQKTLGVSTEKLISLLQGTLCLVSQRFICRKHLQILAGRWVFALQFRRPAMSFLHYTWLLIGGKTRVTAKLRGQVKKELLNLASCCFLLHCNLGASVSPHVIATDASETGGAVGFATELTAQGRDFVQATRKLERSNLSQVIPVLVISLFNGIGGAFRCYDILGVQPMGRIAVEIDAGGNRVTSRRWPSTLFVTDVKLVTREVVQQWSRKFLQIQEIHLWGGFPCTDLSAAKHNRLNLLGSQSSLFWEIPRISKLLREEFDLSVTIKEVLENVASMDKSAAEEITTERGHIPYKLDCIDAVPMRRARFAWTTERLEGVFPDITISNKDYFKEVFAPAAYPETSQWLTPGYHWEGQSTGAVFPTCMKAIVRSRPPPRPAGINKCDQSTLNRWRDDSFRYPPYHYQPQFVITSAESWRLLNASEKELLLGYGYNHTLVAWSASKQKSNPVGFSDARNSYLGDSFSIFSFCILAAACCKKFLPVVPYKLLALRMGLAPGFLAHQRSTAAISRSLSYGSTLVEDIVFDKGTELLNRYLLRRTNHTGSDIRVLTGEVMNSKVYPRQSVVSQWWTWQHGFHRRWKQKAHINVLELEAILWGVRFQLDKFKLSNARIFQLSDSYVCISVVSKGRSSSAQLQRVLNKINATLLAHGLFIVIAHIESTDNPTDAMSRI